MPDSIFLPTNAGDLSLDSFQYFVYYRQTFVDDCEFLLRSQIFAKFAAFVSAKYRLKRHENALKLSKENSGKSLRNKFGQKTEIREIRLHYFCTIL